MKELVLLFSLAVEKLGQRGATTSSLAFIPSITPKLCIKRITRNGDKGKGF